MKKVPIPGIICGALYPLTLRTVHLTQFFRLKTQKMSIFLNHLRNLDNILFSFFCYAANFGVLGVITMDCMNAEIILVARENTLKSRAPKLKQKSDENLRNIFDVI